MYCPALRTVLFNIAKFPKIITTSFACTTPLAGHTFAAVARVCEAPEVFRTVVAVDRLRETLLYKADKSDIEEDEIQGVFGHLWPWCRVVALGLTTSSPTFPESRRDSVSFNLSSDVQCQLFSSGVQCQLFSSGVQCQLLSSGVQCQLFRSSV